MLVVRYDNGRDVIEQPFMPSELELARHMAQRHANRHQSATLVNYGTMNVERYEAQRMRRAG